MNDKIKAALDKQFSSWSNQKKSPTENPSGNGCMITLLIVLTTSISAIFFL